MHLPERPVSSRGRPDATPECAAIADHLAVYLGQIDSCCVDGDLLQARSGDFHGDRNIAANIEPFKGGLGTRGW
jgi:hypothetical protein